MTPKSTLPPSKRVYKRPALQKIGQLRQLTQKTGSTMDSLTMTNSFSM